MQYLLCGLVQVQSISQPPQTFLPVPGYTCSSKSVYKLSIRKEKYVRPKTVRVTAKVGSFDPFFSRRTEKPPWNC